MELENNSESVWVKVFANKTSHYVASWYRQPGGTSEDFQLFRDQLDHIRNQHKGKKLPSVHVLGDFNFRDIDWPDRLNKSGSALSRSEGQMLIDIMNNHSLEQLVHFPTPEKNTLDLLLSSLPGQFQDIHSPDKLSDHDIVAGTFKSCHSPIKKLRRKVFLYQKGDYVLLFKIWRINTSHPKLWTVSSVPWITSEIRKKIPRRNKTHAKAKKTGSNKL